MPINDSLFSSSRKPRFLQLAAEFRRKIETGMWPPEQQIPSLDELMKIYEVSRMTVRQALGELEKEKLIRRGRGIGTFVEPTQGRIAALQLPTTWQEAVAFGDLLDTHAITDARSPATKIPDFDIPPYGVVASSYHYLKRLHCVEGVPYCFSELYVESKLYKAHAAAFKTSPSAAVLAGIPGLKLKAVHQKISIIEANFQSAHALQIEVGAPVAEVRRTVLAGETVVQYARFEFPTRFVKIEFDLLKN